MVIDQSALDIAKDEYDNAQHISLELRKTFRVLSRDVIKEGEPDEKQTEPSPQESLQLASLGIELAKYEKETLRLELSR